MKPEILEILSLGLIFLSIVIIILQQISKNRLEKQIDSLEEELDELINKQEVLEIKSRAGKSNTNLDFIKKIESLEKALQREKKRVNDVKLIAQEANQVKAGFLANVRHEIRTPMNSIMVFADLLSQEIRDKKLKSYAKNIISSSEQLLNLLDDIIELSNVEGGAFEIQEKPTDVKALLSSIVKKEEKYAHKKALDIFYSIDENVPDLLILDKEKVEEILNNIIENAVRYTENGNVEISLSISGNNILKNAVNLLFTVKDTGRGIDKDHLRKIFEIFEKPNFSNELDQGVGLGLAINKKMAKAMHGDINVKSQRGQGSIFTFILRDVEVVLPSQNAQENDVDFSLIHAKHNKFVVLDIDSNSSELIENAFEMTPIRIYAYKNTRDVISLLQKEQVDIIFIDVDILTSDENAVAKILAKISNAAIVSLTSHRLKDVEFFEGVHLVGHLKKPISLVELFKVTLRVFNDDEVSKVEEIDQIKEKRTVSDFTYDTQDIVAFLGDISKEIAPLYGEADMTNDLASIEKFAKALKTCSQKHNIEEMKDFAENLLEKISLFDIDMINSMMQEYQEKIESLKNL